VATIPQTQSTGLRYESAHLHPPLPFIAITQLESWHSFHCPMEGRRLSWHKHCSMGKQPVPTAVRYIVEATIINTMVHVGNQCWTSHTALWPSAANLSVRTTSIVKQLYLLDKTNGLQQWPCYRHHDELLLNLLDNDQQVTQFNTCIHDKEAAVVHPSTTTMPFL